MNAVLSAVLVVVLVILFIKYYGVYSKFNTSPVAVCDNDGCETRNIHNLHENREAAAKLMDDIVVDVDKLIDHLREKYTTNGWTGMNPDKAGIIDVVPSVGAYESASGDVDVKGSDYMQERVNQLIERYNRDSIYEISPRNKANLTSYTENKGDQLVLCLREKTPRGGDNQLHDKNTMIFVTVHELTHIMNDEWGHEEDFWNLFRTMLENATEIGIYYPVDYKHHPINYCGLTLNYSPLF